MAANRVAIIIVNWNCAKDLIACLRSLNTLDDSDFCVVVCDNGSTDGSEEQVRQWLSRNSSRFGETLGVDDGDAHPIQENICYWINIGNNIGFAGANNVGIRFALKQRSIDYFWFLNPDTVVQPGSLRALRQYFARQSNYGICGSTLVYESDRRTIQTIGVSYSFGFGGGRQLGEGAAVDDVEILRSFEGRITYVPGASMLVTRWFVSEIGLMAEDYFLYYEELDWALRSGGKYKIGWAHESVVYHQEGGAIGSKSLSRPSDFSIYLMSFNALLITTRYRRLFILNCLVRLLLRASSYARKYGIGAAVPIFTAIRDFFLVGERRADAFRHSSKATKRRVL